MDGDALPPKTKFFLRGKNGVEAIWGPPSAYKCVEDLKVEKDETFGVPPADSMEFTSDGTKIVLVDTQKGFTVYDTETSSTLLQVEHEGIQSIGWSPKNSFLLTWQRPLKDSDVGNLLIWDACTGEILTRFNQRQYARDNWPFVEWSSDEKICTRQTSNGVMIYSGNEFTMHIGKINLPNAKCFSVGPAEAPYKIAIFVPEKSGKPASVKLYEFPNRLEVPVASKSFYKAQEVSLKWSPNATALIIETRTDTDTSGKSYYGETGLLFLQADGQYDCVVPLMKEGQVHDVQWDPTGRGFVVLAGAMPSSATLYDNKACPTFEFGTASRNHISWSPHGRFLCIAGFGNLAGDMDFWDRNKLKKMGSANANSATYHTWSPDSRYFVTATTFPRLRVDNGFKIFKYDGTGPIYKEDRDQLYELSFRPAPINTYPNRPQSPKKKTEGEAFEAPVEAKPQAYRPPRSTGAFAASLRSETTGPRKLDKNKYVGHSVTKTVSYAPSTIPGMAPMTIPGMSAAPSAKKSSKSARKKKAKEAAEIKAAVEIAINAAAIPENDCSNGIALVKLSEEDKQKKLKSSMKKMKRIELLKERKAAGEQLNVDQEAKLQSEASLRSEIEQLARQ